MRANRQSPTLWVILCLAWFGVHTIVAHAEPVKPLDEREDVFPAFWDTVKWTSPSGSPVPQVETVNGRKALRFLCNFKSTLHPRAVWDLTTSLEFTNTRGISFSFYAPADRLIPPVTAYLRTGQTWYSVDLFQKAQPQAVSGWYTLHILKSQLNCEGQPQNWRNVDRLRIAAWRCEDADTEFFLADPVIFRPESSVVLVRGDFASVASAGGVPSALESTARIDTLFTMLGVSPKVISDLDLTGLQLEKTQLAVLPYNPILPEPAVSALRKFLRDGGKLLAFRDIPDTLSREILVTKGPLVTAKYPGEYHEIRATSRVVEGMPLSFRHTLWGHIRNIQPLNKEAVVVGEWFDPKGGALNLPAVIVSPFGAFLGYGPTLEQIAEKRALLLGLSCRFVPGLLSQSLSQTLHSEIVPFESHLIEKDLRDLAKRSGQETQELLQRAYGYREEAQEAFQKNDFWRAYGLLEKSRSAFLDAWVSSGHSPSNEWRAFWCHSPLGAGSLGWEKTVQSLAENGFGALLANFVWAGSADYRSEVLPNSPEVQKGREPLAECLDACKRHGVELHVWKVCWNVGNKAPSAFLREMEQQHRFQVRRDGTIVKTWLCPSHPKNRQLEVDVASELASQYDLAGIHLDYMRFESSNSCYCEGCRKRFEQYVGKKVPMWPDTVELDGEWKKAWLTFRRETINDAVQEIRAAVRRLNPKIRLSAAVYPNWQLDRDAIGQDWKYWCEKGFVDFVCPMTYTAFSPQYASMVRLQRKWAEPARCYPGIGLSTWAVPDDVGRLAQQIDATRRANTGGFVVFDLKESVLRDVLPYCGRGLTVPRR